MFKLLLLFFLTIPVIEIYLLIKVGGIIGALPTIGLIILTAVIGAWLLRQQGLSTLHRVQTTLASGEIPALEVMEGMVLLVCGALLLTPGFATDTIGFLGLIPAVRQKLILWLLKRVNVVQVNGEVHRPHPFHPHGTHHPHHPKTIEGEYRRED